MARTNLFELNRGDFVNTYWIERIKLIVSKTHPNAPAAEKPTDGKKYVFLEITMYPGVTADTSHIYYTDRWMERTRADYLVRALFSRTDEGFDLEPESRPSTR